MGAFAMILGMFMLCCVGLCPFFLFGGLVISAGSTAVQNVWSRLVVLMVFLPVVRIGEAANPGPEDAMFVLVIANPSGLRSKAPFVATQMAHGDIWAFSETHLCSRELSSLNAGLKFANAPFAPMLGGYPVPVSKDNTGAWKGLVFCPRHLFGIFPRIGRKKLPNLPESWS